MRASICYLLGPNARRSSSSPVSVHIYKTFQIFAWSARILASVIFLLRVSDREDTPALRR